MKSVILGTGASEGIPAPFCECPTCTRAREMGGKYNRTRSDFLIDEESLIDYGPDIYNQCVKNGISLRGLKNIFITHSHEDHIFASELMLRSACRPFLEGKVKIFGSDLTLKQITHFAKQYVMPVNVGKETFFEKNYELVPLEAYKTYDISGMKVTPIYASHYGYGVDELGYNYIITNKEGKTFLYASDTGWYRQNTWDHLKNCGIKFDFAVIECTYGDHELPDYLEGHFDYKNLKFALEKLEDFGNIDTTTPLYLTHICHLNTLGPDEMVDFFSSWDWNIIPGYDGLQIS
ncbi:MAG: hypothetical protein IKD04_01015 [Clostridia bacterium]|nr:hypothetical protein [Clostridia bacterium]